jgi:hypothetical protein
MMFLYMDEERECERARCPQTLGTATGGVKVCTRSGGFLGSPELAALDAPFTAQRE